MTGDRTSECGSSIIEAVVAVGIFGVVAMGLSPSLLSTRKVAELTQSSSIATALASDKIEELRARGYSGLTPGTTNDPSNPLRANGTNGGIFNRSWTVTEPSSGLRRLVVSVQWRDRPGNRTVSVVGVIAR